MTKPTPAFVLVPFVREKSGHISVSASLGGKVARLIVDTGAGATCIDTEALKRFKVGLSQKSKKGGGVGSSAMKLVHIDGHDLKIANVDLTKIKIFALDLSHVNQGLAQAKVAPIDGVLGADVLSRHKACIDYSRGLIILSTTGGR